MDASEAEIQGGIGYGLDQYPNDWHHHMDLDLWSEHNTSHIYENPGRPEFSPKEVEHVGVEKKRYPYMAIMPDILDADDAYYNYKNIVNPKSEAVRAYMNRNVEKMKNKKPKFDQFPSINSIYQMNNNMVLLLFVFIIILSLIYVQYVQSKKINKLLREIAMRNIAKST